MQSRNAIVAFGELVNHGRKGYHANAIKMWKLFQSINNVRKEDGVHSCYVPHSLVDAPLCELEYQNMAI